MSLQDMDTFQEEIEKLGLPEEVPTLKILPRLLLEPVEEEKEGDNDDDDMSI